MIHSRLQKMPCWHKLLQPQTATAPNCCSPKFATAQRSFICPWCLSTRPRKHQTLLQLSAGGFCVPNTHRPGGNTNVHLQTWTVRHISLVKFTADCRNCGRISAFSWSCTQQKQLKLLEFLFLIFTEKCIFSTFGSSHHLSAGSMQHGQELYEKKQFS